MESIIHSVAPAISGSLHNQEALRPRNQSLTILLGLFLFLVVASALPTLINAGDPPLPRVTVIPSDDLDGFVLLPSDSPTGPSVNMITVRNSANVPVANAQVIVFLTSGNVICGSAVLTGVTNSEGEVTITLAGGGCVPGVPLSGVIKANGVTLRAYENVKSPDSDGNLIVDIADLITFSGEFLGGPGNCHDYNNSGATDLQDLVIFGPPFSGRSACAP